MLREPTLRAPRIQDVRKPPPDRREDIRIHGPLELGCVAPETGPRIRAKKVGQRLRRAAGERPTNELAHPRDIVCLDLDVVAPSDRQHGTVHPGEVARRVVAHVLAKPTGRESLPSDPDDVLGAGTQSEARPLLPPEEPARAQPLESG